MKINKLKRSKNKFKSTLKKNFVLIAILCIVLLVFLRELNLFNNVHYIIKKDYYERAIKSYNNQFYSGFCNKSSHGYIFYIIKKFSDKFGKNLIPKIINHGYRTNKIEYWLFYNVNANINEEQIVLLNYNNKLINLENYKILDNYDNRCFFLERKNG